MDREEKSKTIARVCKTLELKYKPRKNEGNRSPLDELIFALLIQDSSEKKAKDAFKRLKSRFVDWNEVRVSSPGEISETIGGSATEDGKAETIKKILGQIFAEHNRVSLDFLTELKAKEARNYLFSLEGVPPFAVASVLLSLDMPAIPVDDDIARISSRIGLVKESWAKERMQKSLESIVPKSRMYHFFKLCREHARKVCLARSLKCRTCPIAKECATRKTQLASRRRSKTARNKAIAKSTSTKARSRSRTTRLPKATRSRTSTSVRKKRCSS